MLKLATLFLISFLGQASAQFDHYLPIDSKYTLYWNYTNTNLTARIQLTSITTPLNYWISFGITNQGSLTNSDLIVAWMRSGNKPVFTDAHFMSNTLIIVPDVVQTWTLLDYNYNTNSLYFTFTRYILLNQIDKADINIIVGTPYISWAYGILTQLYQVHSGSFLLYFSFMNG
jgi:hypothetical protein